MILRRSLLALLSPFVLLAPAAAFAGTNAKPNAAPPLPVKMEGKTAPGAKPALWKVADEDTTIWLFGTIHILPAGIDWYAGPVAKALESSDTLVTEIVAADDPAVAAKVGQIALSNPQRNLREQLPADVRKEYEAALTALGLPVSAFDANDPWYAAVVLSTLPVMKEGYDPNHGAETLLAAKAMAKGLPQIGLETAEGQLGLFDTLPAETQVTYLREVLKSFPEIGTEIRAMIDAWKDGKADDLAKLMNEEESDPLLMKVLLVDRNKAWAQWIAKRLEQPGTVFVAVGAGHLAGRESVQAQLAAAKIQSKRVR
jgi:uncharacterized protein YbaP (TraB family)